jgi:5'-nucleotidase (lipoprotein e(P4) family)
MKVYLIVLMALLSACATQKPIVNTSGSATITNGKLFASFFQQQAAEYKALCFQAYNVAQYRLHAGLAQGGSKPKAIITDIDETVLDNSAYDIHQTLQGKDYEAQSWNEWTSRGEADTVPGAPTFLKYAASNGVRIFYITNRDEKERAGTLANLKKFNLPDADNEHLIMRQSISSKEQRRQEVMKTHDVVLLIGDNLADFSDLFDKKPMEERNETTRRMAKEFGSRFIILPNPVYGDWETALYQYNSRLTLAQKDSILRASVKSY